MFLDGPEAKARDAVHVILAGERVRREDLIEAPDVMESEQEASYKILNLDALVRMKLTSFRLKDQVHIQDMIQGGLVNNNWLLRVPAELAPRLKQLLDNPDG